MPVKKILYQSVTWRGGYYITVFFLNTLIARHYGAGVSGQFYYLINIYSLVLLATGFTLESGIVFFISKGQIDPGRLFFFSFCWAIVIGITALLYAVAFLPQPFQWGSNIFLFSIFTFIGGNLLINYCAAFFYARNNFIIPNAIAVGINLILILLLGFQKNAVAGSGGYLFFYLYFGSFLLQGLLLALAVKMYYAQKINFGMLLPVEFKKLLRYCLTAYFSNLVFFLLYRVDYWFVKKYCTVEELGNYIQVSKIGQLFFVLPTILASAVFPLAASGSKHLVKALLPLVSRTILWLYMFICLVMVLFGKAIFVLLFGNGFTKMYPSFLFLIPGILSLSMLYTLTAFFAGENKIGINIKGALLALFFVVPGDIWLIPRYGINAASFVSSIGYCVYLIYVVSIFVRGYKVPVSSFIVIKSADFITLYKKIMYVNKTENGIGHN